MDGDPTSEVSRRLQSFGDLVNASGSTLDEMTLALAAAFRPRLDVASVIGELDAIAAGCPEPSGDGVVRYLFDDCGFRGDDIDYHDWQNSCLDRVMARRRGMPITLSVVAIVVGRRLGVPMVGIGLPGHFLVGQAGNPDWFADPFRGRGGLGVDDCRAVLASLGIDQWSDRFVDATPDRLIVARILNNLRATSEQRNDRVRLAIVMRLRALLDVVDDAPGEMQRAQAVLN